MTREQLDAIRARMTFAYGPHTDVREILHATKDLHALLVEVERLRDALAMAVQVSGELCEKCGWAMKFPGEKCRCELLAEVERLTADPLPAAAWVREVERAAFQRGVAAMREAAVAVASKRADLPKHSDLDSAWCRSAECILDELRHLPDPEDTE